MATQMEKEIEEAKDTLKDLIADDYDVDDSIHELAEQITPIYNWDRLEWAMHDMSLALTSSEFTSSDSTPIDIIGWNIYEHVGSELRQWYEAQVWVSCDHCYSKYIAEDLDEYDLCPTCAKTVRKCDECDEIVEIDSLYFEDPESDYGYCKECAPCARCSDPVGEDGDHEDRLCAHCSDCTRSHDGEEWQCDNDHTGCIYNDGHNTCIAPDDLGYSPLSHEEANDD